MSRPPVCCYSGFMGKIAIITVIDYYQNVNLEMKLASKVGFGRLVDGFFDRFMITSL